MSTPHHVRETRQLRQYGRRPPLPLTVLLPDGRRLEVLQWLRILPGKRLVGQATLGDDSVLVKLFIAPGARRHWIREKTGVEALIQQGIPTPELVASGRLAGGGRYLLTRYLHGSQTQRQRWGALSSHDSDNPEAQQLVAEVIALLAEMHREGLTQSDLHMGNFLWHQGQLHVIDGDAVEVHTQGKPLSAADVADNLGAFLAQLPVSWTEQQEALMVEYLRHNDACALDPQRIARAQAKGRQWRLKDYLSKAGRDCSLFSVRRNGWRVVAVRREEAATLLPLLQQPDALFVGDPLLKNGGSSTVTRFGLDDRSLVIKRYNIKSFTHWLRRFWRPTRAWHSWLAAHRLEFLDIATPAPLAVYESRFGPLRRRSWLVTAYCAGPDILSLFDPRGAWLPPLEQREALIRVFRQLAQHRITHGDCKATNLLWQDGKVWLIDLDAMHAHRSDSSWRAAWYKDRARLIRNWPADSEIARWLEAELPQ